MPTVSVITGVHNARPYLLGTVRSVLAQSFGDFEYLIADDGSTDGGLDQLRDLGDGRLRLLEPGKVGRSQALNLALAEARGEFAAILDADDLCRPDRLMRQVALFRADPELTVAGSACWLMDEAEATLDVFGVPLEHACIAWQLLFHNAFVHSSAMFRLSAVRGLGLAYQTGLEPAEDYAFLAALAWHGKAANDERPLVRYRVHQRQLSQTRHQIQMDNAARIRGDNLARLGWTGPSPEHARDWFWGLPVEPRAEHLPLLEHYLELLGMLLLRPHVHAGSLAPLREDLLRSRERALRPAP